MADLKEVRSSNRTDEGGRLFHCTIVKGKMKTCSSLDIMVRMCCSCHSDIKKKVALVSKTASFGYSFQLIRQCKVFLLK